MKVIYNDRSTMFDLDVGTFGFLALLVRVHRWHSQEPDFRGILVTLVGDTILIRPESTRLP
jgi:hypothetical protein